MLPIRRAAIIALAMLLGNAWLTLHRSGYRTPVFCERLSLSLEKYGLYGYAIALRLVAVDQYLLASRRSADRNADASQAAIDAAVDNLLSANGLLSKHGKQAEAEAETLLLRASHLAPTRPDVRGKLLASQMARGDPDAAIRVYDLAYREEDPEALYLMAQLYIQTGKSDDALGCLRHAATQAPEHFGIRTALAGHLLTLNANTEAAEHARVAARVASDIDERLEAAGLLRATGSAGPTRSEILRSHYGRQYAPGAAVVFVYLLIILSPWLTYHVRRVVGRDVSN